VLTKVANKQSAICSAFVLYSLVCNQVVPTAEVTPPQTNGWKVTVAGILLVLLVASSVQLSLVANITKLPKVRTSCDAICLATSKHVDKHVWCLYNNGLCIASFFKGGDGVQLQLSHVAVSKALMHKAFRAHAGPLPPTPIHTHAHSPHMPCVCWLSFRRKPWSILPTQTT
jgi:hypothetical protein